MQKFLQVFIHNKKYTHTIDRIKISIGNLESTNIVAYAC